MQPAKVVTSYRSLLPGLEPSLWSGLTVELLTLASLLQENKWRKVREELESEEGTLALLAATLRREGESQELVGKALVILKATDYSIVGEQEVEAADHFSHNTTALQTSPGDTPCPCPTDYLYLNIKPEHPERTMAFISKK